MTMRRSSDVPWPYAVIRRHPPSALSEDQLQATIKRQFKAKKRPAVWLASKE